MTSRKFPSLRNETARFWSQPPALPRSPLLLLVVPGQDMEGYRSCGSPPGKRAWKKTELVAVVVAFVVVVVVLAVALPTVLCQQGLGSASASMGLAQLEKELEVTNQSLAEARGQWDNCKQQLGVLEGKASELEEALAKVTQLQEENRELKAEVAQQQQQLEELQSSRDEVQLQNQHLKQQLQDMRSQYSGGNGLLAMSLSLLVLFPLLPGILL